MRLNEFELYPLGAFETRCGRLRRLYGKAPDTPAPDPRLVDAQIRSLGIQEDAIGRMMSMSEELAPLQRQQLSDSIGRANELWQQNQGDRGFALGKRAALDAIQTQITADASGFSETDRRSDADVAQAFQVTRGAMDRDLGRQGVNPNDGRAMAAKGTMAATEALARVHGRRMAGDSARTERLQLFDRANNTLAGYPAMTMGAQGQGVGTMGAGQQAFNAAVGGMMAPSQAIGGAAGSMGSNAANMWGQQSNAYQQAQRTEASGGTGLGAAVGAIAGAFLPRFWE